MEPKAIVVDLDSTLLHFSGGKRGIFSIFTRRSVSEAEVLEAYRDVKERKGFTFSRLLSALWKKVRHVEDSPEDMHREFSRWLKKNIAAYRDSRPAIRRWRKAGIPVIILTQGERSYQTQKIRLKIPEYDELIVVGSDEEKVDRLKKLLVKYGKPIVFLDDKVRVHDLVRDAEIPPDAVITVIVRRPDSSHVNEEPRHSHLETPNLEKIVKVLRIVNF